MKILLTIVCLFSPASFAAQRLKCSQVFRAASKNLGAQVSFPTVEEVANQLYAYHVTEYLPSNGAISANIMDSFRFSCTVHFALGEPVLDHFGGSCSKKSTASCCPSSFLDLSF